MGQSIFLLFFLLNISAIAQSQGEIKSIQLYPEGNEIGMPIIHLRNKQPLILEFDYFGEEAPYFNYKIEHFDANWNKTNINPLTFIQGFNTGSIDDFEFSFDTKQLYTHYEFEFPNNQLEFKISGNYMISVYEDSPTKPVFREKFMVTEQSVVISGAIKNAVGAGQLESHHQIDFEVNYQGIQSNNPRQEFQANVIQNFRPDNMLTDIKPQRFTDEVLFFTNPFDQNFGAGNEFRWFNIRSVRYQTESIAEVIERNDGTTHVYLIPDLPRKSADFFMYNDFNGQYVIDHQEGTRPDLDGDYVFVHFTLKESPELKDKDIYVYGELTNWEIKDEYKLKMNQRQNLLEAVVYLKQGNYDYMYIMKTGNEFSSTLTEGNYYRTENDYTVFVYYKPFGARYDRLVGVQQFDSRF